mgnify:CR=1 FL=1
MKLLKYILGAIAFIGGMFALNTASKKKDEEFDNQIKDNEKQVSKVQEQTKKAEEVKDNLKKDLQNLKKENNLTKKQLQDAKKINKVIEDFESKYRKK